MTPFFSNAPAIAAKMSSAIRDIAKLTGFSERQVTLAEAASILKTCAGRTKVARPDQIDLRTRIAVLRRLGFTKAHAPGDISINAGRRGLAGLMWVKTQKTFKLAGVQGFTGQQFTPANRHWRDRDWTDIQEAQADSKMQLAKAMPLARQSAGLARQSWIQIADDLGIRLEDVPGHGISSAGIAKARAAMASSGRHYINGLASEQEQAGKSYFVTLINRLPYGNRAGLPAVLLGAIAGRVGLFRRTFAKGAFKSIEAAARNYPWIKTALSA